MKRPRFSDSRKPPKPPASEVKVQRATTTLPLIKTAVSPRNSQRSSSRSIKHAKILERPQTSLVIPKPIPLDVFLKAARKIDIQSREDEETRRKYEKLKQKEGPDYVEKFITNFIHEKNAQRAARLIQRCWLKYRERQRTLCIINNRLWRRADVLRRVFVGWRGSVTNNPDTIVNCYNSFYQLFLEKPWLSQKHTLSPYPLFCITGRWFYPKMFDPDTFYNVVRVFAHPTGLHIFRLWKSMAHSRRMLRKKSVTFRHTIKKRETFGYVFLSFVLWHRYASWRKIKNQPGVINIPVTEFLIDWAVTEKILNQKKAELDQATNQYQKRVMNKVYLALHQKLMNKRQHTVNKGKASMFYENSLLKRTQRNWMKFMDIQRQQRAETTKLIRAWYTVAYTAHSKRLKNKTASLYYHDRLLKKTFFTWNFDTRKAVIVNTRALLSIQKTPASSAALVFMLKGELELSQFVLFWHEWIRYTKRRRAWLSFNKNHENVDATRREKTRVLFAFRRAAQIGVVTKLVHHKLRLIPHSLPCAFEMSLRYMKNPDRRIAEYPLFEEPTLSSALVMVLHKQFNFDHFKEEGVANKEINHVRSLQDMKDAILHNSIVFKRYFSRMLQRDRTKLAVMRTHLSAMLLRTHNPLFATTEDLLIDKHEEDAVEKSPLCFYSDDEDSLAILLEEERPRTLTKSSSIHMKSVLRHPSFFKNNLDNTLLRTASVAQTTKGDTTKKTFFTPFTNGRREKSGFLTSHTSFLISKLIIIASPMEMLIMMKRFIHGMFDLKMESTLITTPDYPKKRMHEFRRNRAAFVAQLSGKEIGHSVPYNVESPPFVSWCCSVIITVHSDLKGSKLASYCDEIPFNEMIILDSPENEEMRNQVYNICVSSSESSEISKKSNSRHRASLLYSDGTEDMMTEDIYLAMVLLPFIFKKNLVYDLLRDEIRPRSKSFLEKP